MDVVALEGQRTLQDKSPGNSVYDSFFPGLAKNLCCHGVATAMAMMMMVSRSRSHTAPLMHAQSRPRLPNISISFFTMDRSTIADHRLGQGSSTRRRTISDERIRGQLMVSLSAFVVLVDVLWPDLLRASAHYSTPILIVRVIRSIVDESK